MKTFWKVYAVYFALNFAAILVLGGFSSFAAFGSADYLSQITLLVTAIGIVAFAWQRAVFTRKFWIFFLALIIIMQILSLVAGLVYPAESLKVTDISTTLFGMVNAIISYIAIYLYGSNKNPVWEK